MLELTIDSLAFGGNGVGRHDGKAIFVPRSAPGDRLRCRVTRDRGRFAEAELTELLEPGPGRRPAPCPVYAECGGCQWQHLDYPTQCHWKGTVFAEQLWRQARVEKAAVRPLLAAEQEWGYRSRVQFKCRQTAAGLQLGFYRPNSHFVVDIAHCPISAPVINRGLALFRAWLPESPCPDRIPQLDLSVDDREQLRAVVHCLDANPQRLADYLRPLALAAGLDLFLQSGRKSSLVQVCGGEELLIEVDTPPLQLGYGPGGFAQVNLAQNRALVAELLTAHPWQGDEAVLDLFCGMGNFSLPLARRVKTVTGVEDYAPSIASARGNARRNGLANLDFHARPAEGALRTYFPASPPILVLLDPPRSGAYAVARELTTHPPALIAYVSCDPATLARDLQPLLHGPFRLLWSRPIDLFPQTFHIESLTLLARHEP
ncbi:23S rRNA (uracil(1939)-C(5))-methyltransferase RlmD [Desulfuromonas carbonis]|uniref:class I SAM-dependent RNA methyltransferase n=1 Tax=Desulfuromonas sp. DDH964 TaxID=1823759 RepID=UPI00078C14DD|nr:class I SAM-dependent RNA methyltransferase [Desulfuromonas sp. DDH964]AMV72075.1 TrmA family RNA methyltransferase [Desulfuromonas sp. DDH964]